MNIRVMTIEDFDQVHALWMSIKGFGIRSVDDSKEGVERFLMMEDEAVCIMCV